MAPMHSIKIELQFAPTLLALIFAFFSSKTLSTTRSKQQVSRKLAITVIACLFFFLIIMLQHKAFIKQKFIGTKGGLL